MHVLTCPVCQGQMQEINRAGVMIDTCTRCRGVWLDRGELEKLSAVFAGDAPPPRQESFLGGRTQQPTPQPQPYPQRPYRHDDDDDDDDDRRKYYGHGKPYKKSKMSRLLDFFD